MHYGMYVLDKSALYAMNKVYRKGVIRTSLRVSVSLDGIRLLRNLADLNSL